ncbi:protein LSM14 homolog B isoform X2 [Culex pipiens pallens]|uniref:protein LSM14 homolog B isoform X2 n=1 Tax=Culex pipiens pallens TaxID=42434 RepID=UPI0022AA8CFF|nr:protein LSM14 homolog B isoform X2 [Culex pipiens pallens]
MSCPMPEIGSCISLISKADIRYEGLLFTVDPDRCTIALARVKSYGTEDRETQFPIAPQNQCYDYILFRGSDIKDIRVINNNPVPNDPAIMQMHLPPQQQLPPPLQNKLGQAGFQPQPGGFMMPPIGGPGGPPMGGPPPGHTPMGAPYSSFGGINNLGGMLSSANELVSKSPFPPSGGGGGPQAVNQMQQQQQQQQANQQSQQSSGGNNELGNFLVGTSSSDQQSSSGTAAGTTTGGAGRIGSSPEVNNIDGAVVAEHRDQDLIGAGAGGGNAGGSRSTTPSNLLSRKSPTVDMAVQTNQGQQQNRDGNRSGGDGANLEQRGGHQRNRNNSQRSQGQQRERRDSGKNDGGQMKENFNKNNMQQQRQGSQGGGQGGQGGQNQNRGGWNNQNRGQNNNQNNSQNSNNNMRGRPRGPRGPAQGANRTKNLLKFENDYDFEQANNKFEELRSQLSKLKLINNEVSVDTKKDDSGNETGAGDHEPEEDDVQCYDKTKSFFDNISCEAMERAKGKQQRTDWRQERKLNTETFGVGSTRRGGYNRRGGYYNRGPNNYRGNNHQYRGGNNYRGRSHHNNGGGQNRQQNHHQGQGQGQQQHQQQQQQNGLPHNGNRNITNINTNQQQQQQSQQREQQALAAATSQQQQQQQPAAIEVGAGK